MRLVISGMGVVCSAGHSVEQFTRAICAGQPCFEPITDARLAHCTARFAGLVSGFNLADHWSKPVPRNLDRHVQLALAAAAQAIRASGIEPESCAPRTGLFFATCSGPMQLIEEHYARIKAGNPVIDRETLFARRYYGGARILAHLLGVGGLTTTVVTACSASTTALGLAADYLSRGHGDVALVGGADAFAATTLAGFDGLKATNDSTCAPFSRPIGLTLGEGAGFVVLETLDHLHSRQGRVLAEFRGYGLSNDAYHCSAPDPSGKSQALAMERALQDAGCTAGDIQYVNMHGTGTDANDKAETRAVGRVFASCAVPAPVSSTKSMVGHCLGAAGIVELIASLAAAGSHVFAPTAHFGLPREGCTLDYIPQAGRPWPSPGLFMSNNFAFGGNNASVVVAAKLQESDRPARQCTGRVAITGIGMLSAAGIGVGSLVAQSTEKQRLRSYRRVNDDQNLCLCALPPIQEREIDRRLDLRGMDTSSRCATLASRLALNHARFVEKPATLSSLGIFLGLCAGPSWAEEEHIGALLENDFRINHVNAFPYIVPNSVAGNVCRALRLQGHNSVMCGTEGCGLATLALAADTLALGHCEALLSGTVDELSSRILADRYSAAPWSDEQRRVPGEGAVMFLLESAAHAAGRDARVLGRICASAFLTPAADWRQEQTDIDSLCACIATALQQAEITMADVAVLCAGGMEPADVDAVKSRLDCGSLTTIDTDGIIGRLEAGSGLAALARALVDPDVAPQGPQNYILTVFASPAGTSQAVIIEKAS